MSSFLLMRYSNPWAVADLLVIHHSLITLEVIQKRPPLALTARRAGWTGCNILLDQIPLEGRISLIENGEAVPKSICRAKFNATENLAVQPLKSRNWSRVLLTHLRKLPRSKFTLEEAYRFELELSTLYPNNRNIRPKIRQQLQVLRDAGLLKFEGRGTYSLTFI